MGQKDLETCVVLSLNDTEKLKIDLNELEYVCDVEISPEKGFLDSEIKRKLRREIEKEAKKYEADIAVIHTQDCTEDFLTSIKYGFSLYKYKN
ncbi:MAG: hypothetical protein AABX99_01260 [Nanoarchaeota archaeon]